MDTGFWTSVRCEALHAILNASREWQATTQFFSASIRLSDGASSVLLTLRNGTLLTRAADPQPVDVTISGPLTDWERVASHRLDWFQALTPGHGSMTMEGDPVFVMRNVKIFWLLFEATAKSGGAPEPQRYSPAPPPPSRARTGRYVDVDGLDIFYEEAGRGPAILCIHAASQDSLMYRHVLADLSDHFRVIAVDAPGHGKSVMPESGPLPDLTAHAVFNERLIERLGLERPVIIGCSMGGNLVLELAARRPGRYAAVISCEGADYTPGLDDFVLDMLMVNGHQMLECYSQSLTGKRTPPDRAREVIWQLCRSTPAVMRTDLGGYAGFDKRAAMAAIADPTLLIRGSDDWLVTQEQVEATAGRIAGSEVALLDGTGHYPMIENPVEFNATVRSFLNRKGDI
ncbi:alpha/beta fold hydrolase [Sphingobium subterraneum]|uniref:Pimeloyl-ACP methyl ester carboxylesterase/putative sterol carrier protein n=1 Tax=Sphingobium subterraneum TaxID=627688 RepID=A0A841IYD2_9SPHN|nr:alpha/beta fold hydrolase [Sphingobium subterraneum]MBB6123617.1 pimeloyl-ACP methyl ester carboxylesterase/putative sterol carrier protein [Sphingobium subterraneum]